MARFEDIPGIGGTWSDRFTRAGLTPRSLRTVQPQELSNAFRGIGITRAEQFILGAQQTQAAQSFDLSGFETNPLWGAPTQMGVGLPDFTTIRPYGASGINEPAFATQYPSGIGAPYDFTHVSKKNNQIYNYTAFEYGNNQFVHETSRPGGAFLVTGRVDYGGQISSSTATMAAARDSGSFIPFLQGEQSSPFMAFGQMTPQNLAAASTMLSLPRERIDSEGNRTPLGAGQTLYGNEIGGILNDLRQTTNAPDWVYYQGNHIFQLQPVLNETYLVNAEGNYLGTRNASAKGVQLGGQHAFGVFEESPGVARPFVQAPIMGANQSAPNFGQVHSEIYSFRNVLGGEGQKLVADNYGMNTRYDVSIVDADAVAHLNVGDVFSTKGRGPRLINELDLYQGETSTIPGLPAISGHYDTQRITDMTPVGNGKVQVTRGLSVNVAGSTSSKLGEKFSNAAIDESFFTDNFAGSDARIFSSRPSDKDFGAWARNVFETKFADDSAGAAAYLRNYAMDKESVSEQDAMAWFSPVSGRIAPEGAEVAQRAYIAHAQDLWNNAQARTLEEPVRVSERVLKMYAGQTEIVDGKEVPVLQVINTYDDGTSLARYTDRFIETERMERFRNEQAKPFKTISEEELNMMGVVNPQMQRYFEQVQRRVADPARDLIQSVRANYNDNVRQRVRTVNADDIDIAAIRRQVAERNPGVEGNDLSALTLQALAGQTGRASIQVGEVILPSARVAASQIVRDKEGNVISNMAPKIIDAIEAAQNVKSQEAMGGDTAALAGMRDIVAREALAAANEVANSQSTIDRARGVTVGAATGISTQMEGIAANELVVHREKLYAMTNARTDAQRARVDKMVREGKMVGAHMMYPQTDPSKSFPSGVIRYLDEVQQREGMQYAALEFHNVGVSAEMVAGHEKDFDADYNVMTSMGMFDDRGRWIKSNVKAMIANEVINRAYGGFGAEMEAIAGKARQTMTEYLQEGLKIAEAPRSVQEFVANYDARMVAKGWMGKMYNMGVREMFGFGATLGHRAGLHAPERNLINRAMGNLAKRGYQPALDMELPEESLRQFYSLQQHGKYDAASKGSGFTPWASRVDESGSMIMGDDGIPLGDDAYNAVSDVRGVAIEGLNRMMAFGRDGKDNEMYMENVAPDVARAIMPAGAVGNSQMYGDLLDLTRNWQGGEEGLKAYEDIVGQRVETSMFGHVKKGLGAVAPGLGFLGAKLVKNTLDKKDKYQNPEGLKLLPGLSQVTAGIIGAINKFRGVRDTAGIEDAIAAGAAMQKEVPSVSKGTAVANELLGGEMPTPEEAVQATLDAKATVEGGSGRRAVDAFMNEAVADIGGEQSAALGARIHQLNMARMDINQPEDVRKAAGRRADRLASAHHEALLRRNEAKASFNRNKDGGITAGGAGGSGINLPGGAPPSGGDFDPPPGNIEDYTSQPSGSGGSGGRDRIIDNRQFRGGFVGAKQLGEAKQAFDIMKEFEDRMKALAEIQGPLTKAQEKYAQTLIKTQGKLEAIVDTWEKNRSAGLSENQYEADLNASVIQDEDFARIRRNTGKSAQVLSRKLMLDDFLDIAREGERVPQPSREELWGALGGGQSKAARKLRDQWYEEGRFDDLVPGGRIGAKLAEPLAGLSQVTQDPRLLSGVLWRSGLLSSFLIGPAMGAFADYETNRMETAMAGYQGGVTSYRELMDSQYGDIVRRNAARSMGQQAFGQQVGQAYAPLLEAAISPGGSALGAIAAIGGPAYGVGNIAGALTRSPALGNAVTGIGIALAGASYVANNMTSTPDNIVNSMRLMDALQSDDFGTRLQGGFENFGAAIGMFAGGLGQVGSRILTGKSRIEAQEDWLQNPVYGAVARRFNRGELSREQVQMWYGGMAPTVFQAADTLFLQERGYDETGLQFGRDALSQYRRYFRGGNPPDNDTMTNIEAALASGTDINALVQNRMRSYGVNPANLQRGGETWLMSLEAGVLSGDIAQYTETNTWASAYTAQLNPALRQAGLGETSEDYWKRYFDRPEVAQLQAQRMTWAIGARLDSPSYYGQMGNLFGREMAAAAENNDMAEMSRLQNVYGELRQPFDMYTTYGADETETAALLARTRNMSSVDRRRTLGIAGGDAYLTSQNWRELGDIRYQLMDTETGLGALEDSINFTEWTALKEDDKYGYLDGINWRDAREGQRGMRNRVRTIQEEQRDYNFQMQRFQANLSNQLQTGGGTVGLGGWAVGGNLDQVASMFEDRGMDFMRGNGMTYWQIDDANRRINREQQIYNMEQQERGVEINEGQFALADRQFYERWNQSMRKFEYNTGYQAQEMNISRQQRLTQNQWTREDFAYQENMADMQYGWSMEDFDRNLRYSRGRQRLDLLRQRDRAVITHSMESGMRETREERSETQMEWAEQEFQRKKEHFEKSKEFQKEDLEMQKRHYEERRGFERERLEMTRENHEKQKQWMTERFELEDQRVLLDRQNYELQFTLQEEIATKAYEAQVEMTSLNNALSVTAELSGRWAASLQVMSKNLEGLIKAIDAMNKTSTASSGTMSTAKMEELLSKIASQPAQVNATIYTNKQSINTGSFMSEASTKLRR